MKAVFSPGVIAELRQRVIAHNEALPAASRETTLVKLGILKGLYKRWHNGASPHDHALEKIDAHLATLRGEASMNKARRPGGHNAQPRDQDGRFEATGGGHGGGHGGGGGALASNPDDGDAPKTQIIPETRFSTFGPPIAGAAGVLLGSIGGATATLRGGPLDRLQTNLSGFVGGKLGLAQGYAINSTIRSARGGTRATIGLVNRVAGSTLPRPGPNAGEPAMERILLAHHKGGRAAGRGLGHATTFVYNAFPAITRRLAGSRYGWLGGMVGGAIAPGALFYAPAAHRLASTAGPYLDAAFPRKVRKIAGPHPGLLAALAKQRAPIIDADADALAKANLAAAARLVAAGGRRLAGGARGLASRLRRAPVAPPGATVPPISGADADAARAAFTEHAAKPRAEGGQFAVKPNRLARTLYAGGIAGTGASAGAGLGAIAGAGSAVAAGLFSPNKHPRDEHGRFTNKGGRAKHGARLGAAIGLGLGVGAGLIAARQGHTALLRQALARLGGAAGSMRASAAAKARDVHAQAYVEANRSRLGSVEGPPRPPGSTVQPAPLHQRVAGALEQHAEDAWTQTIGAVIKDGHQAWYRHQLDTAFDKVALRGLRAVATEANGKRAALVNAEGQAVRTNLFEQLDTSKLNKAQKKLWQSLTKQRETTLGEIDKVFVRKREIASDIRSHLANLQDEKRQIGADLNYVPRRAAELEDAKLADIVSFAKDHLGHDIQAKTKAAAFAELETEVAKYPAKQNERLATIEREIEQGRPMLDHANAETTRDMTDEQRTAIRNPFSNSRSATYFLPAPHYQTAVDAVRAAASREFKAGSEAHARAAETHLDALLATEQAALEARVPRTGLAERAFHRAAPVLAARLRQAQEDVADLTEARRSELTGVLKDVSTWLRANKDPKAAWQTAKKWNALGIAAGKKAGQFAQRNWKSLSTAVGLATAYGVIDPTTPHRPFRNRKKWSTPRNIQLVHEWPDPVRRPNEAILGLSYEDKKRRQVFLQGIHIHSKEGAYQTIPLGADVEQVRNQVRQGGAGGGGNQRRVEPVKVENETEVAAALAAAEGARKTPLVGPGDAQFREREVGGTLEQGKAERQVADALYNAHNRFLEQRLKPDEQQKNEHHYWLALKSLFEDPKAALLTRRTRMSLLVGDTNRKRGIFPNASNIYRLDNNHAAHAVGMELRKQIAVHTPRNDDDYKQMRRVIWLVSNNYALPAGTQQGLYRDLEQRFEKAHARLPRSAQASTATAGSEEQADHVATALLNDHPPETWPDLAGDTAAHSSARRMIKTVYKRAVEDSRKNPDHQSFTDVEHHQAAEEATDTWVSERVAEKQAPMEGLRKFLSWGPSTPRTPRAANMPRTPKMAGAAMTPPSAALPKSTAPTMPPIAGAAQRPTGPGLVHRAATGANAAHHLGQIGQYLGGQAGFEAAEHLGGSLIPGGGVARWLGRAALGATGGVIGSVAGQKAGQGTGRSLGDKTPEQEPSLGESGARMAAGAAAQFGTMKLTHGVANRLGQGIAGAATRFATQGLGQTIGGRIGSALGGVAGGVAGTAVEPGGGTAAGAIAGKAIGLGIGAGAGWLADEGVGYLYRHLAPTYGTAAAHQVAKTLGVPAHVRARHAQGVGGDRIPA